MYIFQAPQKPDITIFSTGLFPLCRNETAQKPIKYLKSIQMTRAWTIYNPDIET